MKDVVDASELDDLPVEPAVWSEMTPMVTISPSRVSVNKPRVSHAGLVLKSLLHHGEVVLRPPVSWA